MAETTYRIPLWIIGTVTGILVIGLIVSFMAHILDWAHPCSNRVNRGIDMKV